MAKAEDLIIYIRTDDGKLDKGLNTAERKLGNFSNHTNKLFASLAGIFAVERLTAYTVQMAKLNGEVSGVERGFMRIADADYLETLKESTHGTVNELELMRKAVQANNFNIPLNTLGSLFEFATKRAQETGESVDYLVDSIVTGIGRKSPLILDNLGISAVQLRSKLKGIGMETASVGDIAAAVGQIASDELGKMGSVVEDNGTKIQQMRAQWDDFKKTLAQDKTFNELVSKALDFVTRQIQLLPENLNASKRALDVVFGNKSSKEYKAAIDDINASLSRFMETQNKAGETKKEDIIPDVEPIITVSQRIKELNEKVVELQQTFKDPNISFEAAQKAYEDAQKARKEIEQLQKILNYGVGVRVKTPDKMQTRGETPQIGDRMPFAIQAPELDKLEAFGEAYMQKYREMMANIQMEVDALNEMVNQAIVDGFVGGLEAALNGANLGTVLSMMFSPLAAILEQQGKIMVTSGLGIKLFKESLKSLNAGALIAGGFGLIAAAQGLKAIGNLGVGSGGSAAYSGSPSSGYGNYTSGTGTSMNIMLRGNWEISGDNLKYVLEKADFNDNRTRT